MKMAKGEKGCPQCEGGPCTSMGVLCDCYNCKQVAELKHDLQSTQSTLEMRTNDLDDSQEEARTWFKRFRRSDNQVGRLTRTNADKRDTIKQLNALVKEKDKDRIKCTKAAIALGEDNAKLQATLKTAYETANEALRGKDVKTKDLKTELKEAKTILQAIVYDWFDSTTWEFDEKRAEQNTEQTVLEAKRFLKKKGGK